MFAAPFRLCDSHIFRRQPESTGFKLSGRLQAPGATPPPSLLVRFKRHFTGLLVGTSSQAR
jgi:hypothetical protein